ncbi:FxsA family protein [Magnetovibrio sp.]|uniref:FxsA family protein n=1 Tax=Magnetovibrio sp. TaxID=2024836 RepID=UPI002F94E606
MALLLLAGFIGVPLIEIALFIQVGGAIGLWPTIAVVVLTAIAGTALLRHQGLSALTRLQDSLDRGEPPIDPVFDGFCLLAAGILLLTPGFFTDAIGFLLFTPPLRAALKRLIVSRMQAARHSGQQYFYWHSTQNRSPDSDASDDVIEVDYQDVTITKNPPSADSEPKDRP